MRIGLGSRSRAKVSMGAEYWVEAVAVVRVASAWDGKGEARPVDDSGSGLILVRILWSGSKRCLHASREGGARAVALRLILVTGVAIRIAPPSRVDAARCRMPWMHLSRCTDMHAVASLS